MINNGLEFLKAEARADKCLREKIMKEHMNQKGYLNIGDICVTDFGKNKKGIFGRRLSIIIGTEGQDDVNRVVVVPMYREDVSSGTEESIIIDCNYCEGLDGDFYAIPNRFVIVSVDCMVRKVGHFRRKSVINMICNMIEDIYYANPG